MMYILTYLGHQITLTYLDLRSNFDLDLSRSDYTSFDASWRDKHDRVKITVLSFETKKLLSKNYFGPIWPFDLWWPQFWPELKNYRNCFRMIFYEIWNAVFRFALRCAGAEIDEGCSTPPPPAGGGKSRGPLGRGLIMPACGDRWNGTFSVPPLQVLPSHGIGRLYISTYSIISMIPSSWTCASVGSHWFVKPRRCVQSCSACVRHGESVWLDWVCPVLLTRLGPRCSQSVCNRLFTLAALLDFHPGRMFSFNFIGNLSCLIVRHTGVTHWHDIDLHSNGY